MRPQRRFNVEFLFIFSDFTFTSIMLTHFDAFKIAQYDFK